MAPPIDGDHWSDHVLVSVAQKLTIVVIDTCSSFISRLLDYLNTCNLPMHLVTASAARPLHLYTCAPMDLQICGAGEHTNLETES